MIRYLKYILPFASCLLIVSCSTKKNTAVTRGYHNLTSHYNILFNGEESFKKGMLKLEETYNDDFTELLPVFLYTDDEALGAIASEMDRTIKKSTKMISMHSLTVKPEIKPDKELSPTQKEFYNKKEYNRYIDDAYLLMGKSHFYRKEYSQADEVFNYIISNYPEDVAVFEARIWLARLANLEKRYRESEDILNSLEKNIELPKRIRGELNATYTDLYLRQEQYQQAIDALNKTLEYPSRKFLRTRYTFLLAQLYSKTGNLQKAAQNYDKVIKMNPPYKMAFNAKINKALSYQSGANSRKENEKELQKMLKDDKNIEFQDQIYFALGNLYFKDNEIAKSIENYKLSIKTSTDNTSQKAKSNLTLADIYYAKPDYINAQAYYDSAVAIITTDYPDYQIIYSKSISLNKLVESLQIVTFEDSVLQLAELPKNELLAIIDNLIEKEAEEQEAQKLLELQLAEENNDALSDDPARTTSLPTGGWYFYNPTTKSLGKKEFAKTWGSRKLEDNWRRKNKSVLAFTEPEEGEATDTSSIIKAAPGVLVTNKQSRDFYLQYIPFSDSAKQESLKRIANGLYSMGDIYGEELKDYPKAIESYEELLNRFPLFENNLQVYYRLYILAKNLADNSRMEKYKQAIIRLFPSSNIARMMTNPDYLKEVEAEEKKIFDEYEYTYRLFLAADYTQVVSRCRNAMKDYPAHELYPNFDYMHTIAAGIRKDTLSFVSDLQAFATRYPSTDIAENAKIMITYLQNKKPEVIEELTLQQAKELFSITPEETHYFAYVVSAGVNMNQLIFNVVNFNLDNFDKLKLEVKRLNIDNKQSLCLVQKFNNGEEAMAYYAKITASEEVFRDITATGIRAMVISQPNLGQLTITGKIDQYILFFKENYR